MNSSFEIWIAYSIIFKCRYKVYIKIFTTTRKIWCWGWTWLNTPTFRFLFVENRALFEKYYIFKKSSTWKIFVACQNDGEVPLKWWSKEIKLEVTTNYYNLPKVVSSFNWRFWFSPITFTGKLGHDNSVKVMSQK